MPVKPPLARTLAGLLAALCVAVAAPCARAADDVPFIVVASTTSTENSGLFGYILPKYKEETGVEVRVVAVGTGAALDIGRRCDADALLVHARAQEEKYVAEGFGVDRHDVMYNDFIIVGPSADPAHIRDTGDAAEALKRIAGSGAIFLSRGDESGTHVKERKLWSSVGLSPWDDSGKRYRETGAGMGSTLNTASAMDAYTLTDRATWITFRNKGDLQLLLEGDERLFNQYGVMRVNPERCSNARQEQAADFSQWLRSEHGQAIIAGYQLDGMQLFYPNARQAAPRRP